jgi:hypothetical protein
MLRIDRFYKLADTKYAKCAGVSHIEIGFPDGFNNTVLSDGYSTYYGVLLKYEGTDYEFVINAVDGTFALAHSTASYWNLILWGDIKPLPSIVLKTPQRLLEYIVEQIKFTTQ